MSNNQNELVVSTPKKENGVWITDGAWISGLTGVVSLMVIAIMCQKHQWLDNGLTVLGFDFETRLDVQLLCLIAVALSMCLVEVLRLTISGHKPLFSISPQVKKGQIGEVFFKSLWRFSCYLALFYFIGLIYRVAPEYGFLDKSPYYQPWFEMYQWLFRAFTILGFPYVFFTEVFKYDEKKDVNSYHYLVEYVLIGLLTKIRLIQKPKYQPVTGTQLKKITLGLLVRVFFAPLMTVFFIDQFGHLVSNFGYLFDVLPQKIAQGHYSHANFNKDLMNVMKPIIFGIDVTLAWCGYVLTSRWLDNETQSAEPTLIGWVVCLLSYPPFALAGLYFIFPSESIIRTVDNQLFVSVFSILTIISFIIYTVATIVFGVRFSNLTHRGIIRTGPFAFVRHPAYASKNIGWWLGIFPVLVYLFLIGNMPASYMVLATLALAVQSYWYYWRAITEERHLMIDPAYQEYCEQVKYRFIPGVI